MSEIESRSSRPTVLIADDDPTNRVLMREVIEQSGMEVIEACDGAEALVQYREHSPDLILLDVDMPQVDGFAVCQEIRAGETNRSTPICIMTGLDDFDSADRAYHLGATDFISKPVSWPVLAYRVRYLLRASEALNDIQGLMSALPDVIFVLDEQGRSYDRPTGVDRENISGADSISSASFDELFSAGDKEEVLVRIKQALTSGKSQILEHYFAAVGVHLETRFVARDKNSVLAIVRDITNRKESESQIYKLAYYDRLTGLPNRQLFSQELDVILENACNRDEQFALFFVDLDRFKRINDNLGHSMGDELLKAVAKRLESCTRTKDEFAKLDFDGNENVTLARLGGDEFVIMLRGVGDKDIASSIAGRVVAALSLPLNCNGYQLVVTPSIGIAIYPQDGNTKDELLMNADSAMYRAKAAGRNNYQFFSGTMKVRSLHRLGIEGELRKAIQQEQFELYYQPKVDLNTWSIVGAEALLRWKHAERGWISPVDFIPVAEETGLILPLGTWVINAACQQLKKWRHTPLNQLSVSVNVSSKQVYSDDLTKTVCSAVSLAAITPAKLELEITESLLMRDVEATIASLIALKDLGVGLSIDDFGTGYSSLAYLKRFPIDALKIDRSFVCELQVDNDDAAICAAILAMAQRLDLKVVAEGVELQEQVDYLRSHNCDQIQGYLFSKPVSVDEFEQLFLTHQSNQASIAG